MQTSTTSSRSAVAFQLASALDHYLLQLDGLAPAASGACSSQLQDLTESVRDIRLRCAAFPALQALFIELLIGHSELVFEMGRESPHRSGKARRAALLATQTQRAQNLLRGGIEPMLQACGSTGAD
ncbi:MAG: hypothetical protein ACJ8GO_10345 [Ramlibacter sp.]